ncbi:MAG: rhomboid family intramembrane serine protease [Duncaniella sp.]|nr:rhomboid family intramembrane serine protease [Duncaniella sp.]
MSNSFFSRIPVVTKNLIIINFIVWLAMFVFASKFGSSLESLLGLHYFKAGDFNPAQLVTYMFMHSRDSLAHIFFNMFSLFMFGSVLERTLGSARFLFYYISVGIGAALFQELTWALTWEDGLMKAIAMSYHVDFPEARMMIAQLQASPEGMEQISMYLNRFVTIGASGAIYGVLLAFGMIYPNMPMYLMFIPVPIKAKYMVIGMGVIELLIGLTSGQGDGVAHFVHLGGMLIGLAIILYWKKKGLLDGVGY